MVCLSRPYRFKFFKGKFIWSTLEYFVPDKHVLGELLFANVNGRVKLTTEP